MSNFGVLPNMDVLNHYFGVLPNMDVLNHYFGVLPNMDVLNHSRRHFRSDECCSREVLKYLSNFPCLLFDT